MQSGLNHIPMTISTNTTDRAVNRLEVPYVSLLCTITGTKARPNCTAYLPLYWWLCTYLALFTRQRPTATALSQSLKESARRSTYARLCSLLRDPFRTTSLNGHSVPACQELVSACRPD